MQAYIERAIKNPKTTVVGIFKIIGSLLFMWVNRDTISPEHLMMPETFLPAVTLISGLKDILWAADAKDEIKAKEVKPDTTLLGEK
jgi:hypothetical protein